MDLLVPWLSLNVVESMLPRAWTSSGEFVLSGGGIIECRWLSFEWSRLIHCPDSSSRWMWCRFLCTWGNNQHFCLGLDLGVESYHSLLHSCTDCMSRISPSMSHCHWRDSNCCECCSHSVMRGGSSLNRLARKSVNQESRLLSSLESMSRGLRFRYFAHLISFQSELDAWIWWVHSYSLSSWSSGGASGSTVTGVTGMFVGIGSGSSVQTMCLKVCQWCCWWWWKVDLCHSYGLPWLE